MFTEKTVRNAVEKFILRLDGTGWDYLVKQFPIVFDDKLPTMDKVNLDSHDTFSFANQYYVGFSESRALKQITDYYSENKLELNIYELERNIENVILHEYGHILLEHVFEKPKKTELDMRAQVITAEIETNRGVPKNSRAKYFDDVIISDDKPDFETVKPFITHEAVFNAVKRLTKQMDDKKDDEKDDKKNNQSDNKKNDDNKKQERQDGSSQQPNTPADAEPSENKEQDEKPEKKPDHVGTMVQAIRDAGKDNSPQKDLLTELGLQPSKDFKEAKDVKGRLTVMRKLSQNNSIKKALSKIKGELQGDISKEKVGTYSRPSRKTGEDGLMRRGTKRAATKRPKVLIALDESGSMDCTAVQTAATAIEMLAKTIGRNRTDITICKFANCVTQKAKLNNYKQVVDNYNPYGGTNFGSVVELAENEGCNVILCIGDGEDSLPNREFDGALRKWIDVLITPYNRTRNVQVCEYNELDKATGRRETYWLGNDKDVIEQFAGEM